MVSLAMNSRVDEARRAKTKFFSLLRLSMAAERKRYINRWEVNKIFD